MLLLHIFHCLHSFNHSVARIGKPDGQGVTIVPKDKILSIYIGYNIAKQRFLSYTLNIHKTIYKKLLGIIRSPHRKREILLKVYNPSNEVLIIYPKNVEELL